MRIGIEAACCFSENSWDRSMGVYVRNILLELSKERCFHPFLFSHSFHEEARLELSKLYQLTTVEHTSLNWRNNAVNSLIKLYNINLAWFPFHVIPWFGCGIPIVTTVHDLSFIIKPHTSCPVTTSIYFFLALLNASVRSRRIIAISEATAADLRKYCPWASRKIRVCPHGMPDDVRALSTISARVNAGQNITKLLFLDGGNKRKELEKALMACEKISAAFPLQLVITGSVNHARARCLNYLGKIPDYVEFAGFVPRTELLQLISKSNMLLYLSQYEGFGFPILEALGLGCPVICFDGMAEREVGGEYVSLAKANDVTDLCSKIVSIIKSPPTADEVCKAKEHALQYSWVQAAKTHKEIFEEALLRC